MGIFQTEARRRGRGGLAWCWSLFTKKNRHIIMSRRKNIAYVGVDFLYEHKE
jgi:hypothetical protein